MSAHGYALPCSLNEKLNNWETISILTHKSKKEGKDQESIQSSITPDPGYQWESDNFTIRHHKREPRVQTFLTGDHKALINRRTQKHNKKKTEIT